MQFANGYLHRHGVIGAGQHEHSPGGRAQYPTGYLSTALPAILESEAAERAAEILTRRGQATAS